MKAADEGAFAPTAVRYIKLGAGGAWSAASLRDGTLEWGTGVDPHDAAVAGDWEQVRNHYLERGIAAGTATAFTREARDFYSSGADTLWITFAGGHLWWAFAEPGVTYCGAGHHAGRADRYRRLVGGWRNTDLNGRPLAVNDLSSSLTRVAAYRQTICSVAADEYLLRRIRGEDDPAVVAARLAEQSFAEAVLPLIRGLHQDDFELFADHLFAAMGWRRVSALGGGMTDIDLLVEIPATGERATVQVKSAADQRVLDRCVGAISAGWGGKRFYFVCHSPNGKLQAPQAAAGPHVVVLAGIDLAKAAVAQGLTSWLFDRAA